MINLRIWSILIGTIFVILSGIDVKASTTYTYQSPILDQEGNGSAASFTFSISLQRPLSDGFHAFNELILRPGGISYQATDGYVALTKSSYLNLLGSWIMVSGGKFRSYSIDATDFGGPYSSVYGYDSFHLGSDGSMLFDGTNPNIIGVDVNGQHFPVASGGAGLWSYPSLSAIPEPSVAALTALGIVMLVVSRQLRQSRRSGS